jgi:hypothetical protein
MDAFTQALRSQAINIISISLALISIVLAYIFYRRSQRFKEPCWAIRSITLIEGYSSKVEDLEITYKNKKVENLSISRILFWNSGRETVLRQDITT